MSSQNQPSNKVRMRSVMEIMDEEFKTNGDHFGKKWTQEELNESRCMADHYEELLAAGYTEEEINAKWEGRTPHEISGCTIKKNLL